MSTISITKQGELAKEVAAAPAKEKKQVSNLEFNRYGIISMVLLVVGILGGIAAGFALTSNTVLLGLIAFSAMLALSMVLAVAPMRAIVGTAAVAIVIDLIAILYAVLA